ncbi:MAG: type II toxin-antitoxin system PemK/MazF family toxin [Spiroplasmataceae bacterium]|nr:type II toxin-antitoxin system PemK/MazF family toxin [Spiroplasmataceae bacterium]
MQNEKNDKILFDQIRAFDKQRLLGKIGKTKSKEMNKVNQFLKKTILLNDNKN